MGKTNTRTGTGKRYVYKGRVLFVLSYMVGLGFGLGAKHSGFYPFQVTVRARGSDNNIHSPSAVVLERGKVEGVLEEGKQ